MILWIRIELFCRRSGYTDDAVRSKIRDLVWKEGREWIVAPDGRILIHHDGKAGTVEDYEPFFKGEMFCRRTAWDTTQMPQGSGVYMLYLGDKLQYVGQSTQMMRRVGEHMAAAVIEFDRVTWHPCDPSELLRREAAYIDIMQPAANLRRPK